MGLPERAGKIIYLRRSPGGDSRFCESPQLQTTFEILPSFQAASAAVRESLIRLSRVGSLPALPSATRRSQMACKLAACPSVSASVSHAQVKLIARLFDNFFITVIMYSIFYSKSARIGTRWIEPDHGRMLCERRIEMNLLTDAARAKCRLTLFSNMTLSVILKV